MDNVIIFIAFATLIYSSSPKGELKFELELCQEQLKQQTPDADDE